MPLGWVTPKTNWKNGDYYQYEDAERFTINLAYLESLARPCYPSGSFYFMDYYKDIEIYDLEHDDYVHYDLFYRYDLNFSSMITPSSDNNLLNIFSYGSETLFKLGLLKEYYVDYHKKYPLNYGTVYHDVIYSPEGTYMVSTTGWYISNFEEGIDHYSRLSRAWNNIFNDGYDVVLPRPFDVFINSNYGLYSTNNYKFGNLSFFSAPMLNIMESVMSDLYSFFNEIAEIYPREDVEE